MLFGTNTLSNDATQGAGMWNNVGHQFTGWYSVGGAIISYDNNGYPQVVSGPASTAQAACWTDLYGYPTGTYILRWKGPSPTSLLIRNKNLTPTGPDSSGYYQANVTFTAGDHVEMRCPSPGGISDVSLFPPNLTQSRTFTDTYINLLKPYKVCRLMPMSRANGKELSPGVITLFNNWSQRTLPSVWSQTDKDCAWEYCLQLCKEASVVPWINIPFGADDSYINSLAQLVKSYSFPSIILEHSNEYWNQGWGYQWAALTQKATSLGIYGTDPNIAGPSYHADLLLHAGDIFKNTVGSVYTVLGAQAVYERWAYYALLWAKQHPTQYPINALAVAPYFMQSDSDDISTVAKLVTSAQNWVTTYLVPGMQKNKTVADSYGCDFTTYEAGQSFVDGSGNAPATEKQWNASISAAQYQAYMAGSKRMIQTDPAISQLYQQNVNICSSLNIKHYMHFMLVSNWGRSGFWGLKQASDDADGPKSNFFNQLITS
jgi:hypothetical protein